MKLKVYRFGPYSYIPKNIYKQTINMMFSGKLNSFIRLRLVSSDGSTFNVELVLRELKNNIDKL
jgi:hypothetical protein